MKHGFKVLWLIIAFMACPAWSVAQPPTDSQITEARGRGVEFIRSKQLDEGHWAMEGHDVGITALCALALVENGLSPYDPVIEKAHRFVKKNSKELGSTYDIALAIVLLSRLDEYGNKPQIRDLGARLIAGQNTGGGWSYSCPAKVTTSILINPETRPKPPEGPGDNSCTQFAVLGLWTASRSGIDIDQPMAAVARRFKQTQNPDGGWPYTTAVANQGGGAVSNPSGTAMTFAGLFCLTVARANKLRKQIEDREISGEDKSKSTGTSGSKKSTTSTKSTKDKPDDKPAEPMPNTEERSEETSILLKDTMFAKGLQQAGVFVQGGDQARYFLWSIERLGVLLGLDKFGGVDWFAKGSEILVKSQQADGSWGELHNDKGLSQTAFAILFLRKANLGSDISRLLEGDPEKAFVILGRPDKPRFLTLDEALKAAKPGETIRVDGDGPFKLPHLIIDKNVTIEAGYGYLPTFVYDAGFDSRGLRSRPDKDPEARYMLKVSNGNVILEGLKFEFDPPEIGSSVSWAGIRVAGGTVRLLNCSITEEGRKGSALIELAEPGDLRLKNCLLGGGRAAIEISAKGTQSVDLENCLLFSDNCVSVVKNAAAKEASTALKTRDCTFQGTNAFHAPNVMTPISIVAESNLFKTDWIGGSLLVADNSKKHREWSGADNVFGTGKWVGSSGRAVTSIIDAKSFAKFWELDDKTSSAKQIVFEGKRPNKSASHRMKPTEFALAAQSELGLSGNRTGMQFLIVGAGRSFSRFRESTLYTDWKRSLAGVP